MKRWVLLWAFLLGLAILSSSCAPSAPAKAPPSGPAGREEAQAPAGPPQAGGAPAPKPAAPGEVPGERALTERMIIYNAQLSMEVKDVNDSLEAIAEIARRQGGFVVGTSQRFEGERRVASAAIRVPSRSYHDTLAELRRLAIKVNDEVSKSQDVTEEYTDLGAQLTNLEATEAQYRELLKRAGTIEDILKVQAKISETRREIERIKGRMTYLERTTEMASITVSLSSKEKASTPSNGGPWKSPGEAWEQSLVFLGNVASAIAIGVAFFWWLILLIALIAALIWRVGRGGVQT